MDKTEILKLLEDNRNIIRRWESFYGKTEYRWRKCPWVWEIEFEVVTNEEV